MSLSKDALERSVGRRGWRAGSASRGLLSPEVRYLIRQYGVFVGSEYLTSIVSSMWRSRDFLDAGQREISYGGSGQCPRE
jgi:hypothetical protein